MTEPMSDQRLAEIRAGYPFDDDRPWFEDDVFEAFDAVPELVAEVDQLRLENQLLYAVTKHLRATAAAGSALWDCPEPVAGAQRTHAFGNPDQQWTECLNGCGMTWARLQEATS
jgi:hypothetical protein